MIGKEEIRVDKDIIIKLEISIVVDESVFIWIRKKGVKILRNDLIIKNLKKNRKIRNWIMKKKKIERINKEGWRGKEEKRKRK